MRRAAQASLGLAACLATLGSARAAPEPGPKPPAHEVSPLLVFPQPKAAPPADATVNIDNDQDAAGVILWPEGALQRGVSGYVTLRCRVDVHGLAETCRVAYEAPPGRGFGAAALALRPTLKITPRTGPQGPEAATLNIGVSFRAKPAENDLSEVSSAQFGSMRPNGRTIYVRNNRAATRSLTMMTAASWAQAPSFADWAAAYPKAGGGVEGYAVAHCKVARSGALGNCTVAKETPADRGFGQAAVRLATRFRASREAMATAPAGAPVEVDVPIRFPPPGEVKDQMVRSPVWIAGADPGSLAGELPPEADGGARGRGTLVECQVTPEGGLAGCQVALSSPEGLAFDEAAVRLASRLRMNIWSGEASPVVGGTIRLPVKRDMAADLALAAP